MNVVEGEVVDKGEYIERKYTVSDGEHTDEVFVYFPKDNNGGNVNATIFWTGSGTSNTLEQKTEQEYISHIMNESNDQILMATNYSENACSPNNVEYHTRVSAINTVKDYIENNNNVNINVTNFEGASAGGYPVFIESLSYLKNNSTSAPINLNLYDPYEPLAENPNNQGFKIDFTPEEIEAMKENNTHISFFTITSRIGRATNTGNKVGNTLHDLGEAGIDVVIIKGANVDDRVGFDSINHASLIKTVVGHGWVDYQKGLIGLDEITDNNYKVYFYENGGWAEYTLKDLVGVRKNPEKYGARAESLLRAGEKLDNMYLKVDHDSLAQLETLSSIWKEIMPKYTIDFASTSTLLPQENSILKSINNSVENLQNLFAKEVALIIQSGNDYLQMEKELDAATEHLNSNLDIIFNSNNDDVPIGNIGQFSIQNDESVVETTSDDSNMYHGGLPRRPRVNMAPSSIEAARFTRNLDAENQTGSAVGSIGDSIGSIYKDKLSELDIKPQSSTPVTGMGTNDMIAPNNNVVEDTVIGPKENNSVIPKKEVIVIDSEENTKSNVEQTLSLSDKRTARVSKETTITNSNTSDDSYREKIGETSWEETLPHNPDSKPETKFDSGKNTVIDNSKVKDSGPIEPGNTNLPEKEKVPVDPVEPHDPPVIEPDPVPTPTPEPTPEPVKPKNDYSDIYKTIGIASGIGVGAGTVAFGINNQIDRKDLEGGFEYTYERGEAPSEYLSQETDDDQYSPFVYDITSTKKEEENEDEEKGVDE